MLIFMPLVLVAAALTVTHVNPFSFPSHSMQTLRMLPMTGFVVLMVGVLVASATLALMGDRLRARVVLLWGLIGTMLVAYLVSNIYREPLLGVIATRAGTAAAERVASEKRFERIEFAPKTTRTPVSSAAACSSRTGVSSPPCTASCVCERSSSTCSCRTS